MFSMALILACWYNVYPTIALLAYDFRRKTKDFALETEYLVVDSAKEKETCEPLIQRGLLGPELACQFQRPIWQMSLRRIAASCMLLWSGIINLPWRFCIKPCFSLGEHNQAQVGRRASLTYYRVFSMYNTI